MTIIPKKIVYIYIFIQKKIGTHLIALLKRILYEFTQRSSCKSIWELNMSQGSASATRKK